MVDEDVLFKAVDRLRRLYRKVEKINAEIEQLKKLIKENNDSGDSSN